MVCWCVVICQLKVVVSYSRIFSVIVLTWVYVFILFTNDHFQRQDLLYCVRSPNVVFIVFRYCSVVVVLTMVFLFVIFFRLFHLYSFLCYRDGDNLD